jgi:hypothetical protein
MHRREGVFASVILELIQYANNDYVILRRTPRKRLHTNTQGITFFDRCLLAFNQVNYK